MMAPAAAYDEIADWYEQEFLPSTAAAGADPLGIGAALDGLLARLRYLPGDRRGAAPVSMRAGCGRQLH
jgi:hypothetical protein